MRARPARRAVSVPVYARARRAGFSLVELLVVVALLGVLAGAVALTVPPPEPAARAEADALAARLARAREEAILGARAVEVELDARGYRFAVRGFAGAEPLDTPSLRARQWAEGVRLALPDPQARQVLRFDATGLANAPAQFELAAADGTARVRVAGDGAVEVVADGRAR